MMSDKRIGRRAACAAFLGVSGGLLTAGSALAKPRHYKIVAAASPLTFSNSQFYDAQGKFKEEAAKKAYFRLMEVAGYPISDRVRKDLWVTDFGLGHFVEIGLGGVTWVNEKEGNYASIEIFLLPNQMIPEHWHVPLEGENVKTKMESWVVRWGTTYTYGEGEPTAKIAVPIPKSQEKYVTVKHETRLNVGESTGVKKLGEKHWQEAGPEGAIVTEISTYHTGAAVRFADPSIKF